MLLSILKWGLITGLLHYVLIGALYGNPWIDRLYQEAQKSDKSVKRWESKARYLVYQFFGTQIEVYAITLGFFFFRPFVSALNEDQAYSGAFAMALVFSLIRVYPRFWNMWIQTTYPNRFLLIEAVNGTISTFFIVLMLEYFL